MKFAHISDCHIGGWREDNLRQLGIKAFENAIDICIKENVGCILITGDLFNTSLPSIDVVKEVANQLNKVRENDINVYIIPGNHDYSASGKTMIDVLENAGLLVNVAKLDGNKLRLFIDKTNIKIAGWHGKRGGLEKNEYNGIDMQHLEQEDGMKIFMFHTIVEEYKPADFEKIECMSVNLLPKGFNYYAGGDPHHVIMGSYDKGKLAYPGPLFPNNFRELERLGNGGFFIIDDRMNIIRKEVKLADVLSLNVDADDKLPRQLEDEIIGKAENIDGKIVLLRIEGRLKEGKISDINFDRIDNAFANAFCLLKNTSKLSSRELDEINFEKGSIEDIEKKMINQFASNNINADVNALMLLLDKEKEDGETNNDFEMRLLQDVRRMLEIEDEN